MTEYNTFCWSERYNDDKSFQQKRYRIFNKEYSKSAYEKITSKIKSIIPNPNKLKLSEFWKTITQDQIKSIMNIEDLEFDVEGFECITGIKVQKELSEVEKAIQLLTEKGLLKDGKVLL
jgi:hypothetical protein